LDAQCFGVNNQENVDATVLANRVLEKQGNMRAMSSLKHRNVELADETQLQVYFMSQKVIRRFWNSQVSFNMERKEFSTSFDDLKWQKTQTVMKNSRQLGE
jgi:hypothetical protein